MSAVEQYGGLREAAARRVHERARAPDGSVASDLPLPAVRAHGGRNAAAHSGSPDSGSADASAAGGAAGGLGAAGGAAPPTQSVSIWLILVMTVVMSFLSGVGALPYLFTGKLDPYWSGIANAVGCGVMLAASFDLLEESKAYSAPLVLCGIVLGVVAMAYSQAWLSKFEDVSFSDLQVRRVVRVGYDRRAGCWVRRQPGSGEGRSWHTVPLCQSCLCTPRPSSWFPSSTQCNPTQRVC